MMRRSARTGVVLLGVTLSALAVAVFLVSCTPAPGNRGEPTASSTVPSGPNILVIVTDDQRQGLGVMKKTREIFRRGGTDFTNAFVSDPLCCPSRASIFTGQYPHNHHVENEEQALRLDQASTVQRFLQGAGYLNGIFGKYLNSWDLTRPPPFFDKWAIFKFSQNGYRGGPWNVDGDVTGVSEYSTSYISHRAQAFVRQAHLSSAGRPWFLYLAPAAPHAPYTPEGKYSHARVPVWHGNPATRERDRSDKPPFVRDKHKTLRRGNTIRRKQFRTLMSVDDMVGKIFAELRQLGEASNTLAIFTSDNGWAWGEHGVSRKLLPYTPSVKVPLLARWPGHIAANQSDHRLISNVDIAPTILDAAGLSADPRYPIDGRSLLDRSASRHSILTEYFADPLFPHIPSWAAIRTRSYEYTEYYKGSSVVFREYYNLSTDPFELENVLADANPGNDVDTSALSARLARAERCSGASCP
jgi:arylsulfatase A-like enzyme